MVKNNIYICVARKTQLHILINITDCSNKKDSAAEICATE